MKKNKEKLSAIRRKIDKTDIEIIKLINKRASLAKQTAQFKRSQYMTRSERKRFIKKISTNNHGPLKEADLENIYSEILSTCREIQSPKTISYLGPVGSHTQEAADKKFGLNSRKNSLKNN